MLKAQIEITKEGNKITVIYYRLLNMGSLNTATKTEKTRDLKKKEKSYNKERLFYNSC